MFKKINKPMTYAFSILSTSRINLITITFALFFILGLSLALSIVDYTSDYSISPAYARPQISPDGPTLNDPNLTVQTVYQGLKSPTSIAFLGLDDVLILEKGGTVLRIINGEILPEPLLQVKVMPKDERGLLGIAIASNGEGNEEKQKKSGDSTIKAKTTETTIDDGSSPSKYVFLFFTEAGQSKGDTPGGNRVYKYQLVENNTKLVNPTLLLDLPA